MALNPWRFARGALPPAIYTRPFTLSPLPSARHFALSPLPLALHRLRVAPSPSPPAPKPRPLAPSPSHPALRPRTFAPSLHTRRFVPGPLPLPFAPGPSTPAQHPRPDATTLCHLRPRGKRQRPQLRPRGKRPQGEANSSSGSATKGRVWPGKLPRPSCSRARICSGTHRPTRSFTRIMREKHPSWAPGPSLPPESPLILLLTQIRPGKGPRPSCPTHSRPALV